MRTSEKRTTEIRRSQGLALFSILEAPLAPQVGSEHKWTELENL